MSAIVCSSSRRRGRRRTRASARTSSTPSEEKTPSSSSEPRASPPPSSMMRSTCAGEVLQVVLQPRIAGIGDHRGVVGGEDLSVGRGGAGAASASRASAPRSGRIMTLRTSRRAPLQRGETPRPVPYASAREHVRGARSARGRRPGRRAAPASAARPRRARGRSRPRAAIVASSQPSTSAISARRRLGRLQAAVPGLDRDPRAAGEHVVEVQRALVRCTRSGPRPRGSRRRPAAARPAPAARRSSPAARRSACRSGAAGARSARRAAPESRGHPLAPVPQRLEARRRRAAASRAVADGGTLRSSPRATASIASRAITR